MLQRDGRGRRGRSDDRRRPGHGRLRKIDRRGAHVRQTERRGHARPRQKPRRLYLRCSRSCKRDDAPATTKALRALTNGIRARDENAKQTCQAWAQSSPRLAELFHAYSAPGGRDADSKTAACFRTLATMLPLLPEAGRHLLLGAGCGVGPRAALRSSRHKIRDEPPWKPWRRAPSAVLGRSKGVKMARRR